MSLHFARRARRWACWPAVVCSIAVVTGSRAVGQEPARSPGNALARAIDEELRRRHADGWSGAILVEHGGGVVLDTGYGYANRERTIRFTTSTVAQIGSITKQFTAAAIIDLAAQGRLRVTDSVAHFLPTVRGPARSISLHELLTHTGGMPEYCGRDFDRAPLDDFVARCLNGVSLTTRGTYAYSNPGYSVLALVVEHVTRTRLEDYLRDRFFTRLGMHNIGYEFAAARRAELARCYRNGMVQPPVADRIAQLDGAWWNLKGNGGMQASSKDMYRWYRALREGDALPPAAWQRMITPHVQLPQPGRAYGYGWNVHSDSSGTVIQLSHSGSDGVCAAAIVWRPADDVLFYIVGNSGDRSLREAASAVVRLIRERGVR